MNESTSYVPGMCNINREEVAYRRKAMFFGIALSVIVLLVCIALNVVWWVRALLLFVPVFIAAIGYLQVQNKFCVNYGSKGQQNAADGSKSAVTVTEPTAVKADKTKSRVMNTQALFITIAVLLLISLLPSGLPL